MHTDRLDIVRPDDWHLHLRDGEALASVVGHTARRFARAIVMPNLKPPVTTVAQALAYRGRILAAVPAGMTFEPLMTLYLTRQTTPAEIFAAKASGQVFAVKFYPQGATTHSDAGVADLSTVYPVLEAMEQADLPLLVHGEVTDHGVDIFDREKVFIDRTLTRLLLDFPELKVVLEHITTAEAAAFVRERAPQLAATITPHHLMINRTDIFTGGIRPHFYCLPIAKREEHRLALRQAATSGEACFFLGTDTAPHAAHTKEAACGCAGIFNAPTAMQCYAQVFDEEGALDQLEAFASLNGPRFYGLPVNKEKLTLRKAPQNVPADIALGSDRLVVFGADSNLAWSIA